MSFETRYRRFVVVQGVSLLNERVLGPLRLKHVLYSFIAILLLWRGLTSGSAQALGLAAAVGLLTVFSALYPRRSMGFEAYLLALLTSLLDVAASSGSKAPSRRKVARETTKRATARVGDRRTMYAGVAAALAGAFLVTCGVVLRSVFLVVAGGFPMGVGLALALGMIRGKPS